MIVCPHCSRAVENDAWILLLNDMRSEHFETLKPVARARTREALVALVALERVEQYGEASGLEPERRDVTAALGWRVQSTRWIKVFRKGGPLEWCNPPTPADVHFVRMHRYVDLSHEIDPLFDADLGVGA